MDKLVWRLDHQGVFSVNSLRNLIVGHRVRRKGDGSSVTPIKWIKSIPKKISIFIWRVMIDRLPSRSYLDKIGIDLDSSLCPRCESEMESVNHALFSCEKVKFI